MSVSRLLKHTVRPRGTTGIDVQLRIAYSCDSPPANPEVRVTGFNYLGFVFMSGYEVAAYIDGGAAEVCELAGCGRPMRYRFRVLLENVLVLGIGFNSAVANGALCWKSAPKQQVLDVVTPCFCCDDPTRPKLPAVAAPAQQPLAPERSLAPALAVVALVAVPAALVALAGEPSLPGFLSAALWGLAGVGLASVVAVLGRRGSRALAVDAEQPERLDA